MLGVHDGGCLCGAVRYRVEGAPLRAQACHCRYCQRRTGSAGAVVVAFKAEQVELNGATLSEYEHRSDESGRWLRNQFCARCGTTLIVTLERNPSLRIVSGGSFDDPNWFELERHIWTRSAPHWMCFCPAIERFEKGGS